MTVKLGDYADFLMGQAPPGADCNFDQIGHVFVKAGEFGPLFPSVREWTTKPLRFAREGDVLICVVGATAGKLNLAINCAIGRSVAAIRPSKGLQTKYLYYQLLPQVERLRASSAGSAQGVISKPDLANIPIVVVAPNAQRQVVSYLDEQLSRLDASVAALHRVQGNLKRYRASVLKAACEGRLVPTEAALARQEGRDFETGAQLLQRILAERRERWTSKRKWKEPPALVPGNESTPPEGWSWAIGEALFDWSSGVNLVEKEFVAGEVPVFGGNGVSGLHSTHNIEHDTLVIGRVGAQCGNVHLSRGYAWITDNAIYSQSVPSSLCLPFAAIALGGENLNKKAAGSGQPFVNQKMLNSVRLPLPPLSEQHRIVAEADRRLSLIHAVEAQVAANLARAQRLRQSILQAAFATPASAGQ